MTDITQIKLAMHNRMREVAEYLLPRGILDKREWCVGSIAGEPGQSLKICVAGPKVGVWTDFAAGGEGGDAIDLWCLVRRKTLVAALDEIRDWLGINRPQFEKRQTEYRRPAKPKCTAPRSAVLEYLTRERKLSEAAIRAYHVAEDGRTIVFPSLLPDGTLAFVKYLSLDRTAEGKKNTRVEAGCEPILFGWSAIDPEAREVTLTEGECLPGSSEILTPSGWCQLQDYRGGLVAQWNEGRIEWVNPLAKIETAFDGELIRFYGGRGFAMTATPGHRMLGLDYKGRSQFLTAEEREVGTCKHHRLPRSGVAAGNGIGLTLDQIAFCIAIQADAAVDIRKNAVNGGTSKNRPWENRYARVTLFKGRKIDRMTGLLSRLDIGYCRTENQVSSGGCIDGVFFGIPLPEWVPGRILPWDWIVNATTVEREFIIDELTHWDGNNVLNRNQTEYASKYLYMAEWVQALCHTTGRVSTIMRRKNSYGSWFKVSLLHGKSGGSYQSLKTERIPFDGTVYCVKVPSGAFVARENENVFITGNCDALTSYDYGFPALSVPFGGGGGNKQRWIESEYDRMSRFEVIYLALDMDAEGNIAAEEIANRLGRHRCRRVQLPQKDLNECRKNGITAEEIHACFDQAGSLDPPELMRPGLFADAVVNLFWPTGERELGYQLPFGKVAERLFFRPGEISEWTGATGVGKSQLLSYALVAMAEQGARACVASLEMAPAQLIRRMVKQAGNVDRPTERFVRDIIAWMDGWLWMFGLMGKTAVERLIDVFEYARCRYGCDVFAIDSLMRLGVSSEDYEGQEKAIFELVNWAVAKDVHVHLVAHARKAERNSGYSVPDVEDVKGTSEIASNAANILGIWRNKKLEDEIRVALEAAEKGDQGSQLKLMELAERPPVLVNVAKQRNGDWEGRFGLWFNPTTYQYRSSHDSKAGRMFLRHEGYSEAAQ